MQFSAGPGAALGLVVVGSTKGWVIALDGRERQELWRAHVNSELLSAPAISEKIVVHALGRRTPAWLRCANGKELWSVEQQVPRLSLRGTAMPVIAKEIGGQRIRQRQGHGRVAHDRRYGLGYGAGIAAWPNGARPAGRRRLGRERRRRQRVRRRAFKGVPPCSRSIRARSGGRTTCRATAAWRSTRRIYIVTQSDGIVVALRQRDGSELWRNDKLKLPRIEHAGRDEHGHRRRRLPGISALAGQGDRRARRARARGQVSRQHAAGRGAGYRGRTHRRAASPLSARRPRPNPVRLTPCCPSSH